MVHKIAIFDRDNTLIKDKGYVYLPKDLVFLPQTIKALSFLSKNGVKIYVVTNQAGIGYGKFKKKDLILFHKKINQVLKKDKVQISKFYYCPHHINAKIKKFRKKCKCRKPGNFLIEKIKKLYKRKKIVMIGNKFTDKLASEKSKIKFYYRRKNFFNQIRIIYNKDLL